MSLTHDTDHAALDGEQPAQSQIRAYAVGPGGAHTLALDAGVELFHKVGTDEGDAEGRLVWIDIVNPGDAEAEFMRERLKLHPLAVEDCLRGRQRPKLERYPGYFFIVMYAARINPQRWRVAFNELHAFFGNRFIITVHDQRIPEVKEMLARCRSTPDRYGDVGRIAHGLLDSIVDSYFGVIDHFSEHVTRAEGELIEGRHEQALTHVLHVRRELVLFRRVVAPVRDIIARLVRRELPNVSPALVPYFQDVRDHAIRITEEIDTLRELVATIMETQRSASAQQLNQTVRMLTAWSIILMSMAVVAGIYGMNFSFMPELQWRNGYFFALGVMVLIALAQLLFFRRRRWL